MSGFGKVLPSRNTTPPFTPAEPKIPVPNPASVDDLWWVKKARAELGVTEIVGKKNNPRVVFYHSFTTLKATDDETPWCSAFMCFVFGGGTHSAAASSWATWGQHLDHFIPGCICVYERPGGHHVNIGLRDNGETITGLGGNQQNAVTATGSEPISRLIAMRWPPGTVIPA